MSRNNKVFLISNFFSTFFFHSFSGYSKYSSFVLDFGWWSFFFFWGVIFEGGKKKEKKTKKEAKVASFFCFVLFFWL
jgi:hypothetical protein